MIVDIDPKIFPSKNEFALRSSSIAFSSDKPLLNPFPRKVPPNIQSSLVDG
ncbi:hypothetical protein WN48_10569 [Eufriesea mexicana]|uniref:Uncharacterized protein n=1 Tax=Eufriesea mexicana TaxID=516756 RepID=A0A310SI47_9HYME|nr:hypothetical protein WN48_10569 [Eufriesea mexicana]